MIDLAQSAPRSVLKRRRFALLLASLITLVLISPIFGSDPGGETDLAFLFSLVVIGFAITSTRIVAVSALSALWLMCTWTEPFAMDAIGAIAADLALFAICAVAAESALRRALRSGPVGAEELCAAVAAYLIMGVGWAAAYSVLFALDFDAFTIAASDAAQTWNALLYFSFATLTTLGYGDIVPASAMARAWCSVEAVTGTIYLAILIAHLVGSYQRVEGTGTRSQHDGGGR